MAKQIFAARFSWLSALPLLVVIAGLSLLALNVLGSAQSRDGGGRDRLFDLYQRLIPAETAGVSPFHVIEIDRESIDRMGPWPWPRSLLANIVERTTSAGAKGVILVEAVDAPDPLSPETIGAFWLSGVPDEALAQQLSLLPSTDRLLARALEGRLGAVAIDPGASVAFAASLAPARTRIVGSPWVRLEGGSGEYVGLPTARARFPVNAELEKATRLAVSALPLDADGLFRAAPLAWSVSGRPLPSIALEAARIAAGGVEVRLAADESAVSAMGQAPATISVGDKRLAVSSLGALSYYPPRRIDVPSTPAWRILDERRSAAQLSGKVALIGRSAEIGDAVRTPRGTYSAASMHALLAEQIAAGAAVSRPSWIGGAEAIAVMLLGAAAIMWSQRLTFWRAVGIAAAAAACVLLISFAAFAGARLLIDPIAPAIALLLGAFSVAGGRSLGVVLKDDAVRGAFQGALPEPTMKRLREESAVEILQGAHREITVLACELRLLDEDLEKLTDAAGDVANLIASASTALRKSIIDIGGAADQADGGKVFAYFNAPGPLADHARAACAGALRLVESMDKINAELALSPRLRDVQIHLAIGIATGECFVGPMGHGRSNRYSAVGPAVDLAAFLRRQAEFYGPAIICDDSVHREVHHHFAFLEVEKMRPRDGAQAFSIYALVGNPFIKSSKGYRALEEAHRALLAAYRAGDWAAARTHLARVRQSPGARIALFDIYEERIRQLAQDGAPENWDGVLAATI